MAVFDGSEESCKQDQIFTKLSQTRGLNTFANRTSGKFAREVRVSQGANINYDGIDYVLLTARHLLVR
jgi:hypothetical protein